MISEDQNIFESIPKDNTIFYWIPTIFNILQSKSEFGDVKIIIDIAKKEIKKVMVSITKKETNENDIQNKYILKMLSDIDESAILRNREMICYLQSLKLLEEYIKNQNSGKKLKRAINWYKKGEINGKRYLESISQIKKHQDLTGQYFY